MLHARSTRSLCTWGFAGLAAGLVALAAPEASAAKPTNGGKRFRFHGETEPLSFTHFNPDGDGDNFNTFGFGFGRTTAIDARIAPSTWSLGFGYVFLGGNAIIGARFAFQVETTKADDAGDMMDNDTRATAIGGQLIPYFRYLFLPGKTVRPYVEGRFGVTGTTVTARDEDDTESTTSNTVGPVVGAGGGAHIFITDAFSVDAGLTFDYAAPHSRSEVTVEDTTTENDYEKDGDLLNIAAQVGFSVWF
ncbi:MAG: outer membrane beta-barrel protein [Myxococcota bacterium]